MFCQNCGKQIPDDVKFCSGCGTPVPDLGTPVQEAEPAPAEAVDVIPAGQPIEPAVPAEEIAEDTAAPAPETGSAAGTAVQLEPLTAPAEVSPLPETSIKEPVLGRQKGRGKALALLAVAAVVAIVLVVGIVKLVSGIGGGGGKPSYVYLTGDDELMFLKNLKPDANEVELTDEESGCIRFSPDGKYLYFGEMDGGSSYGDLYRIEIARIGKDGVSPEKISSDVNLYNYQILKNGKLVFLRGSGDGQLRYYDGSESYKIAGGIYDFIVNEAETYVYYTETDSSDYTSTLYRAELKADGEKERLLKGADEIFTGLDADLLVYSERREGSNYGDPTTYTVYSVVPGGEKEKLASDVSAVNDVTVNNGKVSLVYTVAEDQVEGQNYSTYTVYSVTSGGEKEKLVSGVDDVYVRSGGEKPSLVYTTREVEEHSLYDFVTDAMLLSDADAQAPDTNDFQSLDPDWGFYTTDWTAYYAAYDVWREVSNRNNIRDYLKSNTSYVETYSIHTYENGETATLAEDVSSINAISLEDGIYIYAKQETDITTVADVSDLSYGSQIYSMMDEDDTETVWYQNVNGQEEELDLDEDYSPGSLYVLNGSEVVLLAWDKDYESALLSYTLNNNQMTAAGTITDDDFSSLSLGQTQGGKDALYYFTDLDSKSGTGELICYSGGEKTSIAKEAWMVLMLSDGKTTLKLDEVEYNTRRGTSEGTLYTVQDGKSTKIASEVGVYSVTCLDAKQIVYISDGDLYLWNGSESTRLASDVSSFWASEEMEYDYYLCQDDYGYGDSAGW